MILAGMLAGCSEQSGSTDTTADSTGGVTTEDEGGGGGDETGTESTATSADIPQDSKLFWGQAAAPVQFDPTDPQVLDEQEVYNYIFSPLYNHDEGTGVVPHLATDMPEITREGRRYTFSIREEARFHNGDPVTAEDVKYSLNAPIEYQTPATATVEMFTDINVVDETTVELNLEEPYAPALQSLVDYQVVPKAVHQEDPDAFGTDTVIGSGPFEFDSFTEGESAVITRWDDYWGPVQPNLAEVEFRPINEPTTRVTALETDEVDAFMSVPPQLWNTVDSAQNSRVEDVGGINYFYTHFNMNEGPTTSREVRHAVDHCIDMNQAVDSYVKPAGVRSISVIPKPLAEDWDLPHQEWAERWNEKDIDKAKELFENAGVPDGYTFNILTPPDDVRENIGISIGNGIQEAGYNAEVQRLDWGALVDARYTGNADQYDMYLVGLLQGPDPDLYIYRLLHSSNKHMFWDSSRTEEFDGLIEEARTIVDRDQRRELYEQIIDIYLEERLQLAMYRLKSSAGVKDRVKDFFMHPSNSLNPPLFRERIPDYDGNNVWVDRN
jgi:peptide/nickel transport system substrate-binding protein